MLLKPLLLTTLLAGTLDAIGASLVYVIRSGKNPLNVFRFVASGVFGKAALSGGTGMAMAGLAFHYFIAFSFTLFFFMVYPKLPVLGKNPVVTGLLYGVFVWLVMNQVVLPLSRVTTGPFNLSQALVGAIVLMLAIGLPISLLAHRYFTKGHL